MARKRPYRLLCPIARGLDRLGDRWALLILRDLHAGPARFKDLEQGLTGIATNLLTTRLQELQEDGLIRRREAEPGVRVYELTKLGRRTDAVIFALAEFGARFPAEPDLRRPGNLRLIVVPLKMTLQQAVDGDTPTATELWVDDEAFALRVANGQVSVQAGPAPDASVSVAMAYEPMLAVWEGDLAVAEFAAKHVEVRRGAPADLERFMDWMGRAVARNQAAPR
jgi:DNA-binding HxlR family transcriptional regulator